MDTNIKELLYHTHLSFVRSYATYKAIADKVTMVKNHSTWNFWGITYSNAHDIAVINWCNLFSEKEALYWEKHYPHKIKDYKKDILNIMGTEAEFIELRNDVCIPRNKNIAHLVPGEARKTKVPKLEEAKALELIYLSFDWYRNETGFIHDLRNEYLNHYQLTEKILAEITK